jgi:MmgE/PrpD N-terminal domain
MTTMSAEAASAGGTELLPARPAASAIERVVASVASVRFDALDAGTVSALKMALLDCLAVMIAGADEDVAGAVGRLARDAAPPEATIVRLPGRVSAAAAALANGTMAHACDYDDSSFSMWGTPPGRCWPRFSRWPSGAMPTAGACWRRSPPGSRWKRYSGLRFSLVTTASAGIRPARWACLAPRPARQVRPGVIPPPRRQHWGLPHRAPLACAPMSARWSSRCMWGLPPVMASRRRAWPSWG